ncbi:MAG: DNA primase [Clostridia bacterium]|nr:DNA primase [Clostridia bacterium]
MNISPQIIEDIKARNDIERVVSSYITLKRAGSNFNGSCPFHSEKTPSFTVFPSTQSFYCFGCGAGGDAITFVMRMENLDYVSAIRTLAERSGVTIPDNETYNNGKKEVTRSRVLEMNKEAARFFRNALFDPKYGTEAMDYLTKKRNLSTAVIKHFGLGFAPNSFGALHDHLKRLGYTDDEMVTGFLCGKGKNGSAYDYFRNRIMFPIIDVSGNVVAFGGRVMDNSEPKYLNTSDTPAFKKSKNLFALNFAKNHCEANMILCEGYMDVISLHAAGFQNAVATLGTAITSEQARIFSRYTKKVVISYDSDQAGQRAADKAFNLLQEVGVDVKILKMEGAKDPDEYIKKFGADKFAAIIEGSKTRFEFETDKTLSKYNIANVDEKIKASRELCRVIASFSSDIERELYSRKLSSILDIPLVSIQKEVAAILRKRTNEQKSKEQSELYRLTSGLGDRVNPESASNIRASKIEEALLGIILLKGDLISFASDKLTAEDFVTPFCKSVYESIVSVYAELGRFDISYIQENFTIEQFSRITKMMTERERLSKNDTDTLKSLIESLKKEKTKKDDVDDSFDNIFDLIKNKKKS